MNFKEILDRCIPEPKRSVEKTNPWEYYVTRIASIFVTKPLLKTNVTPTAVTVVSVFASLAGFGLLAFGQTMWVKILGWLGFFLWAVLDCVDGNIARCKNQCSVKGEMWDALGGYLSLALIFFAAGIAAFYDENRLPLLDNYWYIIFGGAASVLSILPRLMAQRKKAICGAEAVADLMNKKEFSLSKIIVRNIESAAGTMELVLLLCITFHLLNVYIIFYFFINLAITLYSLRSILK